MRVGIDYRIFTVGRSAATRGMPRYTQQQLREVLATGSEDEFVLLCDPRTDRSLILPEIRSAPNVEVRPVPGEVTVGFHDDDTMLAKAEVFEAWLAGLDLDVYHATTPFFLDQLIVAHHDACPYVATVYDLIPLIYPGQYLASSKLRQLYLLAAAMVRRASRLLAISEAAKCDASRYLGFPEDRIDVASPIAEPFFRPMAEPEVRAVLAALRRRLGLAGPFVLSVADLHFTKNLETLLRGYSLLPAALRARLPLVVACHLSVEHQEYLSGLAARLGVGGQVVTTGLVSDLELAALYNAAAFVVHPSRFEGFGLPVLEAMQSGTPVIATTASSVPEVAGGAAILVDPDDAPGFAEAIELLAGDPARRDAMREDGLARAATYNGRALADATLAGYRKAAAPAENDGRPRLAVWTPLPPLQSGVADYGAELVSDLDADVDVFVDDGYLPDLELLLAHRVHHFRAFDRTADCFDAVVYQLGASAFHLYMEEAIGRHAGVVVLHDLVWSHVVHHRFAEAGDLAGFRCRLRELEGPEAVAEYDALDRSDHRRWAATLREFLDRHLMLGDIVGRSLSVIVHFPGAVSALGADYPGARCDYVPMGVPEFKHGRPELHAVQARAGLGIGPEAFVVGIFGVVDEVKQLDAAVAAVGVLCSAGHDAHLLVVGPVLDDGYRERLVAMTKDLGLSEAVRFTGHLDAAGFADHLAAVDVVVNLRFPSKKQMSATVLRAAAAGKPVVVSDLPEWAFLPDTFCRRVPGGEADPAVLGGLLLEMAADAGLRESLAAGARAYHRAEATMTRMVAGYVDVLERILDRPFDVPTHGTAPARRSTPKVNLNKVCEIEDFADADLAEVMSDVFSYKAPHVPADYPRGAEYRKEWEIAMAVRALRECGALRPDAVILGVGAGSEDTSFYLTRHVARVVATDRYLSAGSWSDVAPSAMLVDPASVAPYRFDENRLVVHHMDGRRLRFDDDAFDGIFSSGSIEHFGDLEDIAAAAYEMGRVLKPGGVLSLSTEILLSGPPGGRGMPGTLLFSPADLRRYVVEASGLEPVDGLRLDVSQATLTSQRDLASAIRQREERFSAGTSWPGDPGVALPHLIMVSDGYVFGSVHLALRKSEHYPVPPNRWARPSPTLVQAIDEDNRRLLLAGEAPAEIKAPAAPAPVAGMAPVVIPELWADKEAWARRLYAGVEDRWRQTAEATAGFAGLHARIDGIVTMAQAEGRLASTCQADLDRILAATATLPRSLDELAHDAGVRNRTARPPTHGTGWRWCPITLPNDLTFGVMVDPAMTDELTSALLAGGGPIDWTTVMLMLDRVGPGQVVVDLGACLGTFTLAAAAAGCKVIAVEASPANAALLRASAVRNGFMDVQVINAAVGDVAGLVGFCAEGPFGYVSSMVEAGAGAPDLVVQSVTVDALLEQLDAGPVAMVKMDVEGSEIRAIRGMTGLLGGEHPPMVLFESNGYTLDFYGARPADLLGEMDALGYTSYLIDLNRLYEVPPGQVQLQTVVDYFAVRGTVGSTPAWGVEGPLPIDERIARMVRECGHASPYLEGQRAWVAGALAGAEREVLAHPDVVALLAGMRADPAERVREAAGWSAPAPTKRQP